MDPIRSENICLFFEKLPAELRNEVYKSIYEVDVLPVDHGLTLRGQTTLEYSSKKPSLICCCEDFLVNKQFYMEAFTFLVSSNRLVFSRPQAIPTMLTTSPLLRNNVRSIKMKMRFQPHTSLSAPEYDFKCTYDLQIEALKSCPQLIDLEIVPIEHLEVSGRSPMVWQFKQSFRDACEALTELRGLRKFSLPGVCFSDHFIEQLSGIEQEVRAQVTLPRISNST